MAVLNTINLLQGGGAGNAGQPGQPLVFVHGNLNYIQCNTVATSDRLIGGLKSNFAGIFLVRTNPTTVVNI